MSSEPTEKVVFRVRADDGSEAVETLWAIPLGGDVYQLDNSPFYAYGVSWRDHVLAPIDPQEQRPTFQSVVERSGSRTIRVLFEQPVSPVGLSEQILQGLVALGCSYEGANRRYFSINIPRGVELQDIRSHLIANGVQ